MARVLQLKADPDYMWDMQAKLSFKSSFSVLGFFMEEIPYS